MAARCATGSYTGNSATDRLITVGWQPDIVVVKGDLSYQAFLKTSVMPMGKSKGVGTGLEDNRIKSFEASGFRIGGATEVNQSGVNYYWFAIQADGVDVAVGSYTGNGIDNRNVDVGLASAPILAIVLPGYAAHSPMRMADYGDAFCGTLADTPGSNLKIKALYNSGFTVGTHAQVNAASAIYYWIAIREVAGFSTCGTYAGNGVDNRDIAVGGGVVPTIVILQGVATQWTSWYYATFRAESHPAGYCALFRASVNFPDIIQGFGAASFQVGTNEKANASGKSYYWVALALTAPDHQSKSVADAGAGVDGLTVGKSGWEGCTSHAVDISASAKPTAHPWSHAVIALPNALVLIYQEGTAGLMYIFTPDEGVTWSEPALITSKTDVYPSAVADICTGDIHLIYSEAGDPVVGAGHSVWYRSLIYIGTASPAWQVSQEVEVAYGSSGAGYANAVLSVEEGSCAALVAGGDVGKLMFLAQRKTDTDRTWAAFVATAPWTLQGAAETSAALPSASGNERAAAAQAGGRMYAVTFSGGRYAFYRSAAVGWGEPSITFGGWDGWGADNNEGFGLAVDFWGCQTLQVGGATLAAKEAAVAYIKDGQIHYREWSLPLTDDEVPWLIVDDRIIWDSKNAYQAAISRVGQTYRVTAVVGVPSATERSVVYSDGPYYDAWLMVACDAASEDWNWVGVPQYATSGFNWVAAWSETTGPPNNVHMGRCPLEIDILSCEAAVGADLHSLMLPIAEAGSSADVLILVVRVVESGAGADVPAILQSMEDIGIGSEVAGWAKCARDTGEGLEYLMIAMPVADVGAGADAPAIGLSLLDTGAGLEVLLRQIFVRAYDVGAGLDIGGLAISVADAGSGSEIPLIKIAMADIGTGAEVPIVMLTVADIGTAAEIANLLFRLLESGAGGDALRVGMTATDAAGAADSARLIINVADGGFGSEQAVMAIYVTLALLRLLVEKGTLRLDVEGPGL